MIHFNAKLPRIGAVLAIAAVTTALVPGQAQARDYPKNWMMPTHLKKGCAIHSNYPAAGVSRRVWHRGKGDQVKVRYNVDGSWALVQDVRRAKHKPHKINPHYGFIRRSCLARQLPLGSLQGVGSNGKPRGVRFNSAGNGRKVKTIHIAGNATVRDAVHAFVIGNLSSRYHDALVIGTSRCVVASRGSYVHGFAPAAGRWGFVEASHLPGCHIHG